MAGRESWPPLTRELRLLHQGPIGTTPTAMKGSWGETLPITLCSRSQEMPEGTLVAAVRAEWLTFDLEQLPSEHR